MPIRAMCRCGYPFDPDIGAPERRPSQRAGTVAGNEAEAVLQPAVRSSVAGEGPGARTPAGEGAGTSRCVGTRRPTHPVVTYPRAVARAKVSELPKVLDVPPCGAECRVCHPDTSRPGKVSADRLWRWALAHPSMRALRS